MKKDKIDKKKKMKKTRRTALTSVPGDVRFYGVAQQDCSNGGWRGWAELAPCIRFHGTERPHIRSTSEPAHSGASWAEDVQGRDCRNTYCKPARI